MEAYGVNNPLWEIPRPDSFTQLPDDDFLALLQKQFPTNGIPVNNYDYYPDSINPQSINPLPLPTPTPPSEDSSPSPASNNESDEHETPLKRKASTVDESSKQPNSKSQHTMANDKKGASGNTSRRKSGGPDEVRQMKRKEQNRAAQRAFRERKEKHVRDLEEKVAELESKNEQAVSENENLRDLLSRLQNENMMLKQASFTFSVPKTAGSQPTSSFMPDPAAAMATDNLDWGSLTTFDPSVLSLLDDSPSQPTATDGASQLDFGFGSPGAFTTIASNPSFMSFASAFDDPPSEHPSAGTPPFSFDSSPPNSWGQSPSTSDPNAVEDLFNSCGPINFQALISDTPSINNRNSVSPILHRSSPSTSSSGQSSTLNTPKDSSSVSNACSGGADCPKTKEQIREHVAQQGLSVFAPSPNLTIKETGDSVFGPTIMCKGSSFPKTAKSDSNVPVLSAWRTITSNPEFKDADINELCAEFTSKARCDGTKVVLEPQGVHHIMETFSSKKKRVPAFGNTSNSPSDMLA